MTTTLLFQSVHRENVQSPYGNHQPQVTRLHAVCSWWCLLPPRGRRCLNDTHHRVPHHMPGSLEGAISLLLLIDEAKTQDTNLDAMPHWSVPLKYPLCLTNSDCHDPAFSVLYKFLFHNPNHGLQPKRLLTVPSTSGTPSYFWTEMLLSLLLLVSDSFFGTVKFINEDFCQRGSS